MRHRLPDETLGDYIRHQLDTMPTEQLLGRITPLPKSHMQRLAYLPGPPDETRPVAYVPSNRLPRKR